ncbi:MAG: N-acetylmuramoyl-L-alanine amidase, partial [Pseudomonadota bacterium]
MRYAASAVAVFVIFVASFAISLPVAHAERVTRFVAHLNGPATADIFFLTQPKRLVIEVDRAILDVPDSVALARSSMLSAVRFGRYPPGKWRIVVDLSAPVAVARRQLVSLDRSSGRYALVLDLARQELVRFNAQAQLDQRRRAELQQAALAAPAPLGLQRRADGKAVIFIDPGHGGIDSGAVGQRGTKEKVVALRFAKALAAKLRRRGKYHVELSRQSDVYVPLRTRRELARSAGAQLFISVHADSLPEGSDRSVRGTTIYTLSEAGSDQVARALARRE